MANGNDGEDIELVKGSLMYSGSENVLQYVIGEFRYAAVEDDKIEIRIDFSRDIVNDILTIFIPCILICIVSMSYLKKIIIGSINIFHYMIY